VPDEPSVAHWRQCTSAGHGWPSVPVAMDGEKGPCTLPRVWGRLNGSLLFCLRKDVADVSHCPGARGGETLHGRRHISCAPSMQVWQVVRAQGREWAWAYLQYQTSSLKIANHEPRKKRWNI